MKRLQTLAFAALCMVVLLLFSPQNTWPETSQPQNGVHEQRPAPYGPMAGINELLRKTSQARRAFEAWQALDGGDFEYKHLFIIRPQNPEQTTRHL